MIDGTTNKPLYISTDETAAPYIMVPVSQLADLCELLDRHNILYTVDEDAISLDGEPEGAIVDMNRGVDARDVQTILDSVQ